MQAKNDPRRGMALMMAILLTVVCAGVAASLLLIASGDSRKTQTTYKLTRALMCAETGLERKLAVLNGSDLLGGEGLDAMEADYRGGSFEVSVVAWWEDGQDNDGNGFVDDEAEENYMTVESVGTVANLARGVRAFVRKGTADFPDVYGAITLYNPLDENGDVIPGSMVNFSGSPPRISGQDTDIPDGIAFDSLQDSDVTIGSGDGPDVLGVAVHDDQSVADILAELGNKDDRIDGIDPSDLDDEALEDVLMNGGGVIGDGSVGSINGFDPLNANDIYDLAEQVGSYADSENVYGEDNWPAGGIAMGTAESPQVTVLRPPEGETGHLNGTVTGAGVLIIDGHVRFGGTFNYAGLVIITSRGFAEVELTGTPLVFGAIIAANPDADLHLSTTLLDLRGTADVYYSTQGLEIAEQSLMSVGKTQILAVAEF